MLKATNYPAGSEFSKLEEIRISLFCQIESLALSFFLSVIFFYYNKSLPTRLGT